MKLLSLRNLGAAAVLALAHVSVAVAAPPQSSNKFKFLIPVDSSLEEKPLRSSSSPVKRTSVSAPLAAVTTAVAAPAAIAAPAMASTQYRQRFLGALDRAIANDTHGALLILENLKTQNIPAEDRDRLMLAIGRIQYQAGNDAAALEAYKQVRKGGPSWLESLEERSWALLRMGRPQDALASLRTVLTPLFEDRVSSEPYFLTSLAQLRVCDYQSMFRTMDLFKTRFRTKVRAWESSADSGSQARLKETSDTIQKMNLVEAEAIQRLYIDDSGKTMAGKTPRIVKEKSELTFPMDPETDQKEVWLDEVDDYRVTVKGCPVPQAQDLQVAKKDRSL